MSQPPIVTGVTARAVIAPLEHPVITAGGSIFAAPLVLIDIHTDLDISGRAYVFGYTPKMLRALVALVDELGDMLKGQFVVPVDRMRDFDGTFRLLGRKGLLAQAMSGLDMAMWDVVARWCDVPVAILLGGSEKPIPAYDSYGVVDPDRDRDRLEASLAKGFKAIKIRLGSGDLASDILNVRAVREIIGSDIRLMADYNQSLSVPEAARRLTRLAEFDLTWIEEPVSAEDLTGHAQVRSASPIGIQTGENWCLPEDAALAIQAGASDFAMLDLGKIGGITGWQRAAGMCEGVSLPVSSHLFIEASAHVLAATPTAHFLEYLDLAGSVLRDPAEIKDGTLTATGPGLGLEWDEAAVEQYLA